MRYRNLHAQERENPCDFQLLGERAKGLEPLDVHLGKDDITPVISMS